MDEARKVGTRFGANVRALREKAGLTQGALRERARLHQADVERIERGEQLPRVDTLIKLAAALDVAPAMLLDRIEWRPAKTDTAPGSFAFPPGDEVLERAAALRARQSGKTDVVQLVRESREELDRRGHR